MHDITLDNEIERTVDATYKGKVRFNGFCFGINLELIQPAAFDHPRSLFDTSSIMIGQEDKLVEKMMALGLHPKISTTAFAYHFKSVTVAAAGGIAAGLKHAKVDPREDLSFYHPELVNNNTGGANNRLLKREVSSNLHEQVLALTLTATAKSFATLINEDAFQRNLQQPVTYSTATVQKYISKALLEPASYPTRPEIKKLAQLYPSYVSLVTVSGMLIYPSKGDPLMLKSGALSISSNIAGAMISDETMRANEFKTRTVMAFAISGTVVITQHYRY